MISELYLIGLVHNDFKGPERLKTLLDKIRPNAIALEFDSQRGQDADRHYAKLDNQDYLRQFLGTWMKCSRNLT